ncbi:cytochrome P450 [Planomonospora sp. ID91781]|uniref:Cytochrome P450 n=1 Tax=Planomonospora sphaerica TaxID=161355 RepID=A0A171DGB0_9ACTN|nr:MULTISPECIES: cytochrome P450 [Planomonospora]MBG0824691.1 cytochrome P450 [Planomonospora sp. ID91781]GAT68329.1 cytochrome P450 [Planomonospora sphaerica]
MTVSLGEIDLSDLAFWERPTAEREAAFAVLRAQPGPVRFPEPEIPFAPVGPGYYALVRHADVVDASRNAEVFCSGRSSTSIQDLPAEFNEYFGSMINMDDPRHARLRRIVSRAFTPKMIGQFEADVQAEATRIVDALIAGGPGCDFVTEVAARLPLKIICDMMGIPEEHYGTVFEASNIILSGGDPEFMDDPARAAELLLGAGQRLQDLVVSLADAGGDNLITSLTSANIDGEKLTMQELGSFFILLVVAGNETTRNAISHGLHLFTENPGQRELLLADFDGRIAGAVEEIVRLASPVTWMRRTVTRDHEMNGHLYRKGDKVLLYYWAANRDESVFTDPHRFDILRTEGPHVGFGGPGPHFCLGAHLARREITVMFRELFTRLPQIRSAGEPDRLRSTFINGIKHLRCDF